jgi:hypothetical protein
MDFLHPSAMQHGNVQNGILKDEISDQSQSHVVFRKNQINSLLSYL